MRCAFVLKLGPGTLPPQLQFEGWIEEVDTGEELRFRSTGELLAFLGKRFELAGCCGRKPHEEGKRE
jgi:hypothetical protein